MKKLHINPFINSYYATTGYAQQRLQWRHYVFTMTVPLSVPCQLGLTLKHRKEADSFTAGTQT